MFDVGSKRKKKLNRQEIIARHRRFVLVKEILAMTVAAIKSARRNESKNRKSNIVNRKSRGDSE